MKIKINCLWCSKTILRYQSQIKVNNFCSRQCLANYRSKRFNPEDRPIHKRPDVSEMNKRLNPERMTFETRTKLRIARLGTGEGKSYEKTFGIHTHRLNAENKLGRKLLPGEVVHHINGKKRNNDPDNLMIFRNQAEHARWHKKHDEEVKKPNVI